eukprot:CAMPEP_0168310840 /NCGR_PEP_ID=MMETSP0142_2-20121227/67045_1 /TAXON_ID=44445 /ORGANISM="Pseudo-nitzschia australis, Strain 10249 10 AB" /LENGTH=168 /DNA_ID=CAMNT_0008263699 /DNA_START=3531 /DNA_END=4038 /DNA_ORIENTATION=-
MAPELKNVNGAYEMTVEDLSRRKVGRKDEDKKRREGKPIGSFSCTALIDDLPADEAADGPGNGPGMKNVNGAYEMTVEDLSRRKVGRKDEDKKRREGKPIGSFSCTAWETSDGNQLEQPRNWIQYDGSQYSLGDAVKVLTWLVKPGTGCNRKVMLSPRLEQQGNNFDE